MSRKMWELDIYRQQGNTDALVATLSPNRDH
jgi:hypothetical protein